MLIDDCGADVMLVMVTMWRGAQDIRRILLWLHPRCHGGKIVTAEGGRRRRGRRERGRDERVCRGTSARAGKPARAGAGGDGGGEWGMGGLIQELLLKT